MGVQPTILQVRRLSSARCDQSERAKQCWELGASIQVAGSAPAFDRRSVKRSVKLTYGRHHLRYRKLGGETGRDGAAVREGGCCALMA